VTGLLGSYDWGMSTSLLASQKEVLDGLCARQQAVQQMVTPTWVNYGNHITFGTSDNGDGINFENDKMDCDVIVGGGPSITIIDNGTNKKPKKEEIGICLATKRLFG